MSIEKLRQLAGPRTRGRGAAARRTMNEPRPWVYDHFHGGSSTGVGPTDGLQSSKAGLELRAKSADMGASGFLTFLSIFFRSVNQNFEVHTPNAVASARGTMFDISYHEGQPPPATP